LCTAFGFTDSAVLAVLRAAAGLATRLSSAASRRLPATAMRPSTVADTASTAKAPTRHAIGAGRVRLLLPLLRRRERRERRGGWASDAARTTPMATRPMAMTPGRPVQIQSVVA